MATRSSIFPLLRQAAPRLYRRFFECSSCVRDAKPRARASLNTAARPSYRSTKQTPFLLAFRSQSTTPRAATHAVPSPLTRLWQSIPRPPESLKISSRLGERSFFPKLCNRSVGWWLLGSAGLVYTMVVLGGFTRLTESGLSITEWRPVTGTFPPMDPASWSVEFAKYKQSPEYQKLNPNMDVDEFKKIYWMEWSHRQLGRLIGLTTLLPTLYFIARRRVSLPMARNLLGINALIGFQGFIGWWMVKSGLKDDLFAKDAHPRVSQYRLAAHLGLAFVVYVSMLWNGLQVFRERRLALALQPNRSVDFLTKLQGRPLAGLRYGTFGLACLVFTTVLSGAFVAGLDAGLIYNEFPYMGLGLTPPKSELFNPFYSRQPEPHNDLWWRNMLENPSLVQLDHRIMATTTFVAAHALFFYAYFSPTVRARMSWHAKRDLTAVCMWVWVQATLGITTLIYLVPTPLAALHQAGSLAVLTSVVVLGSRIWTPPRLARLVRQKMEVVRQAQVRRARKTGMEYVPPVRH